MNSKGILIAYTLLLIGLLFFLLKENEAKMAALSQLKNTQYKAATTINEKGNAISELETQVAEQEAGLQKTLEDHAKETAEKNEEIDEFISTMGKRDARSIRECFPGYPHADPFFS